jgi:hypothetical protein
VTWRMVTAEVLKLRKRRMVVITTTALTFGIALLVMLVPELYHLAHAGSDPVGGTKGMQRAAVSLAFIGSVAGLIVGSAAGTGDLSTGIFRDLVATGRSRWALFAARVPGVLIFFVPIVTLAFWMGAGLDAWFSAASNPHIVTCRPDLAPNVACSFGPILAATTPALSAFAHWYLWVLLVTVFDLLLSLGVASLVGSRSLTVGLVLIFQLIASPLLAVVSQLAGLRQILFSQSFIALSPLAGQGGEDSGIHVFGQQVTTSVGTAWLVLLLWAIGMVAAGAYRTATRDA